MDPARHGFGGHWVVTVGTIILQCGEQNSSRCSNNNSSTKVESKRKTTLTKALQAFQASKTRRYHNISRPDKTNPHSYTRNQRNRKQEKHILKSPVHPSHAHEVTEVRLRPLSSSQRASGQRWLESLSPSRSTPDRPRPWYSCRKLNNHTHQLRAPGRILGRLVSVFADVSSKQSETRCIFSAPLYRSRLISGSPHERRQGQMKMLSPVKLSPLFSPGTSNG